jgi:hypothetical protein
MGENYKTRGESNALVGIGIDHNISEKQFQFLSPTTDICNIDGAQALVQSD